MTKNINIWNFSFTDHSLYLSHQIQNEMVNIIGSAITDKIVRSLKDAEIFAVMANETPDANHKEQLCSLCVSSQYRREVACSSNRG